MSVAYVIEFRVRASGCERYLDLLIEKRHIAMYTPLLIGATA